MTAEPGATGRPDTEPGIYHGGAGLTAAVAWQ